LASSTPTQTISFVSFGFMLAELLWGNTSDTQKLHDIAQQATSHLNAIGLAISMMRNKGLIDSKALVLPLRVRTQTRFKMSEDMRQHSGMHSDSIGEMARHFFLEPVMLQKWMKSLSEIVEFGSDVVLLCYDARMSRKAASVAIIMQHLLEAMPIAATVGPIVHLARPVWADRLCGPCRACTTQSVPRTAFLSAVRQIWDAADPQ